MEARDETKIENTTVKGMADEIRFASRKKNICEMDYGEVCIVLVKQC